MTTVQIGTSTDIKPDPTTRRRAWREQVRAAYAAAGLKVRFTNATVYVQLGRKPESHAECECMAQVLGRVLGFAPGGYACACYNAKREMAISANEWTADHHARYSPDVDAARELWDTYELAMKLLASARRTIPPGFKSAWRQAWDSYQRAIAHATRERQYAERAGIVEPPPLPEGERRLSVVKA